MSRRRLHTEFALTWSALAAVVVLAAACATSPRQQATAPTDLSAETESVTSPSTSTADASGTSDVREFLARLAIDDRPHIGADYRRDAWPHWDDIDGDGCDARQQALRAASTIPAQVDAPCKVITGNWVSPYDGFTTTQPGDLDIDHIVPLENTHNSGGWAWSTDQRRQYANDQTGLWAVSAASNRSKGASPPDRWRPPNHGVWCEYAQRWTGIKAHWALTATTTERDALGQMLDTCAPGTVFSMSATPTTTPPAPTTTPAPEAGRAVHYANCTAARAAGAAPLHRDDPGYRPALDRDGNGIACE